MTVGVYEPEPRISTFDDLVRMAAAEGPGQKLLVVLVKVERVAHKNADGEYDPAEEEGSLSPYMVRDFDLSPDTKLQDIVDAADEVGTDWEFLMMAVMPSRDGRPATEAEIEPHLTRMAQSLTTGEDMERFAFFTRDGYPVQVEAT